MEISESLSRKLADAVKNALGGYLVKTDSPIVTDIHLQPLRDSGELVISDDDKELGRVQAEEIAIVSEEDFYKEMETILRAVLQRLDGEIHLDTLGLWKPYSFVMVDDEGDTMSELMLFDDDTQLVSQTLMAGLDEELEQFLKDLMVD